MANDKVLFSSSNNISSGILDVSFANAVVLVTLSSSVYFFVCLFLRLFILRRGNKLETVPKHEGAVKERKM